MNVGLHSTVSGYSITASQPSSWCALRALCLQNACEQMPHLSPLKWFRRSWMFLNLKFERSSHNYTHPWQNKKFWHKSKWTNLLFMANAALAILCARITFVLFKSGSWRKIPTTIRTVEYYLDNFWWRYFVLSVRLDTILIFYSTKVYFYVSVANDTKIGNLPNISSSLCWANFTFCTNIQHLSNLSEQTVHTSFGSFRLVYLTFHWQHTVNFCSIKLSASVMFVKISSGSFISAHKRQ